MSNTPTTQDERGQAYRCPNCAATESELVKAMARVEAAENELARLREEYGNRPDEAKSLYAEIEGLKAERDAAANEAAHEHRDNHDLRLALHKARLRPDLAEKCKGCGGNGYDNDEADYKCHDCDGKGWTPLSQNEVAR